LRRCYKSFVPSSLMVAQNKLERFSSKARIIMNVAPRRPTLVTHKYQASLKSCAKALAIA
jgi:hypothetical protein